MTYEVGDYVRLRQCAMYFYGVVIEINPWCASVELANGSIKYVAPSELAHCAMRATTPSTCSKRGGSAREVSTHRYAANIDRWSVTPYVVEIIEE